MQNHDIIFDNEKQRIGFASSNCLMEYDYNENNRPGWNSITKDLTYKYTCKEDMLFLKIVYSSVILVLLITFIVMINRIYYLSRHGRCMCSIQMEAGNFF